MPLWALGSTKIQTQTMDNTRIKLFRFIFFWNQSRRIAQSNRFMRLHTKKRISRNEYIRLQCRIFFCVERCLFTIIRRGQPRYKSRLCHSDGKHIMYQVSCSMSGILGVDQPFKKEKKKQQLILLVVGLYQLE